MVVVVLLGVAVGAGLDSGDPSCGVAEPDPTTEPATDPTAELTPATVVEMRAGRRRNEARHGRRRRRLAAFTAEAARDSTLDAPEVTGSSSSWGRRDCAGAANPPTGAADFEAPERRALPEESRLRSAPATVPAAGGVGAPALGSGTRERSSIRRLTRFPHWA